MAIKRPSKSRGTPVRKSVTPAAVRHIEIRTRQQMVPGTTYEGWVCKNRACALVIALAPPAPGRPEPSSAEDPLSALKCPHCGEEELYRWSSRAEHVYTPKEPAA
jgi:hypothetical protein